MDIFALTSFDCIKIRRFQIQLISLQDAVLPFYFGSMLRGAFGDMLEHTATGLHDRYFNSQHNKQRAPSPFYFSPPEAVKGKDWRDKNRLMRGDRLSFELTLIGQPETDEVELKRAFQLMAPRGLGAEHFIFEMLEMKLLQAGSVTQFIQPKLQLSSESSALSLSFLTHTRIKTEQKIFGLGAANGIHLPLKILVKSMLSRFTNLAEIYGTGRPKIDFNAVLAPAEDVSIISSSLAWHEYPRHSNVQETDMSLGGFMGEIVYSPNARSYLPVLQVGQILRVGSDTSMGHGKYKIE
jgi:hypothetical protein